MLRAARFIIEETIKPAKELYEATKDLDESIIPLSEKEKIEKIYYQTVASEIVISRFKKTGDLHQYLLKSIKSNPGETKEQMNKLNLIPFEDVLDEFEERYKNQLTDFSSVNELIVDDVYTTWDFIFLGGVYRPQSPGILGALDPNNEVTSVIARGNFQEEQTYNNEYLTPDGSKIKYYLIKGNHKYNRYITKDKMPVYFFETIGANQQLFKGIYALASYDADNNYVVLKRQGIKPPKDAISPLEKQVEKTYREKFKPRVAGARGSGGHSKIGQYKKEAGDRAELIVSDYLSLRNIENELIASSNELHHYDIKIKDMVNLEVKNITNSKSFYLSESQIKEYEMNNTRLCFVDSKEDHSLIYISKPYEETKELKKLIQDYLALKTYSIEKYHGRLRVDSVEIGIIKPDNKLIDDLYEDFRLINSLSRREILAFLAKN